MGFEFFTESGRGYRPRASIRRQGQIGLNQGAVKRFSLKDWRFAVLGYDRDRKLVALKLTNDENEAGAQRIIVKEDSASISARSFLEFFDIAYRDKTRQYDVSYDNDGRMLIVALNREDGDGVVANEAPSSDED